MRKLSILFLLLSTALFAQPHNKKAQKVWVDSVYNAMTFEQRVGQLFMVAAYSNKDNAHLKSLEKLVVEQQVGGLIFFQGGPVRQAKMTNSLQKLAKTPLLIGIDGEWGLSMRLDSTPRMPWNMTLGAVQDMALIKKVGISLAEQSNRMGLHFNFGPVVDINTNPKNPIIGVRSYGETRDVVTDRAVAFMEGYQSKNVFATAKHFPGHGDTSTDSHYALPLMDLGKDRLNKVELYPYKKLIDHGLASVMVAHLSLPVIEPDPKLPTSLSYNVVTKLLKEDLGFEGLIFTDALNMKAASNYLKPGEIDLAAFLAGNDVLLFAENVPTALIKFKEAFDANIVTEERLAHSVKKILSFKYKAGLTDYKPVQIGNLILDLNSYQFDDLNAQLYEEAMTLVKNDKHALPIAHLEKEKIAYFKLGDDNGDDFLKQLNQFAEVTAIDTTAENFSLQNLKLYTRVIIGYHKADNPWRKHDFSFDELNWINKIAAQNKTILVSFAKPYALSAVTNFEPIEAVVQAYQNNKFAQEAAAQLIFGTIAAKGKLPVSINSNFTEGTGHKTKVLSRLGFSTPTKEGMDPVRLQKIDQIAQKAIDDRLTPGIQIVVARHGKVVYQKSFGYHTFDKQQAVLNTDVYDLASLTKILGTLPLLMKDYDAGKITMKSKLGTLIPEFDRSDKEDITLQEVLTHQARLQAWVPFYKSTLDEQNKPSKLFYSNHYSEEFPDQVSENLFIKKGYNKLILKAIAESKLLPKKQYKYSDLGFIALKEYLERSSKLSLDQLAESTLYSKLGATTMTYNPLRKRDMSTIPPTEIDNYFRYTTVQGYVHDMTAAMEGGVAGHAGLFANALDVAKMMQMYLQKGSYGEDVFFSERTFNDFNNCWFCKDGNRRGVGFDKPQKAGTAGPTCGCASMTSFGHTGFTGTMTWADPESDLIYVFLSNRTYPDSNDNKLSKANVREDIQEAIYKSIID
ncbi:glycoside hydrolase family 3 N-terminal domain-containing protein [Flavobacterium sp. NKUCC04_CG]|uniref:glycoside hydrolase family 3 N-terminal domain-containing protein n=1 Tax=Flavobacterium sp. NKUCC04_CG TaxID=2842121 RepID=UPI001C5B46F1|nr:glycoside hydrolase family 3 N-terminal domain-containing protein [Flavobacterium sp. NKUCC04_CG]MBW3517960.1 serine hydrolase [Flavobacterium sp. NKUCC04_CG]